MPDSTSIAPELQSALRVHVINLDRNVERLGEFQTVNKHLAGTERFPAVDGQKLDIAELAEQGLLSTDLLQSEFYSIGAVGNAMSHLSLWDRVLKTGKPATIAEDDAIFNLQFARSAAAVLGQLPPDWDIIYWGYNFDLFMMFQLLPGASPCIATFDQQQLRAGVRLPNSGHSRAAFSAHMGVRHPVLFDFPKRGSGLQVGSPAAASNDIGDTGGRKDLSLFRQIPHGSFRLLSELASLADQVVCLLSAARGNKERTLHVGG